MSRHQKIAVYVARVARCPSTTVPRSGLGRRIWEESALYIGSPASFVRFPSSFELDYVSIPRLASFVLAFVVEHRRTTPRPRRCRARRRADRYHSINFTSSSPRFIVYDAARSAAGSTILGVPFLLPILAYRLLRSVLVL
jgi:hypothetical protein